MSREVTVSVCLSQRVAVGDLPEAEVHAPADFVRQRVGRWATITEAGEDRCRLAMTSDSLDWPTMALGGLGAEFTVLHPPELRDYVREWAERFGRATM